MEEGWRKRESERGGGKWKKEERVWRVGSGKGDRGGMRGRRRDRRSKRDSEKACRNQEERREKDVRAKD